MITADAVEPKNCALSGEVTAVLCPLNQDVFFERHWNRRAVYIPGHASKFAGLFDRERFHRAARNCAHLKVGYTDEKGWPAHIDIRPDQLDEMWTQGKTVCASVIDTADPVLTAFLNQFGQSFRVPGRFFFNSYLSPDGAGFGLHLDHHPVSILQIEGQKRWLYSEEPAVKQVMSNVSFPDGRNELKLPWVTVQRPSRESLREVVLSPGDVLYLPKGCWHQAQAIGYSLGLTLAMYSSSLLELIQGAVGPRLNLVEFRDALDGYPAATVRQNEMPRELEDRFASALESLRGIVDSLSPLDLYAAWNQFEAQAQDARLSPVRAAAS